MRDLSRNGYTHQEVMNLLHGIYGQREIKFKYLLLDKDEKLKDELFEVTGGQVEMSAFSDIKKTARFSLRDEIVTEKLTEATTLETYQDFRLGEM
ncbi:hypothetical protein [Fictibacillus sp. NRS-1165]|uniref:hypothetical protein n=1 Tax=Fictibacillus sp. NRS-1165 TaxID=3144463 RepID=UPI003D1A1E63